MAYIIAVNAGILNDTGGICVVRGDTPTADQPCLPGAVSFGDPACQACLSNMKQSLISSTAIACVCAHFLMGIMANMPLGIAPGMGVNAYFAYTVVGFMGTGSVSYRLGTHACIRLCMHVCRV